MKWIGEFHLSCRNTVTGDKWQDIAKNSLVNSGELSILSSYLKDSPMNSYFYIGLTNMASIVKTTVLSSMTDEVVGSGYTRQQIERSVTGWPQIILDSGNYMAISKVVSFNASATWTQATKMFLATTLDNTGVLISAANLSTTRTLVENDILDVTYRIKLQ